MAVLLVQILPSILMLLLLKSPVFLQAQAPEPPPPVCDGYPDSMDLAPDGHFYYFDGAHVYTADRQTLRTTPPQLISQLFSTVEYPVKAAFSTGRTDGRMFIIDSAVDKPVKMFHLDAASPSPRAPQETGTLNDFFPSNAEVSLPEPLTAALAELEFVFFFGGPAGARKASKYRYQPGPRPTFTPVVEIIPNKPYWKNEIKAATVYYSPRSKQYTYYVFDSRNAVQVDANLAITGGPTPVTGQRAQWLPKILHEACSILAPTATTLAPGRQSSRTAAAVDVPTEEISTPAAVTVQESTSETSAAVTQQGMTVPPPEVSTDAVESSTPVVPINEVSSPAPTAAVEPSVEPVTESGDSTTPSGSVDSESDPVDISMPDPVVPISDGTTPGTRQTDDLRATVLPIGDVDVVKTERTIKAEIVTTASSEGDPITTTLKTAPTGPSRSEPISKPPPQPLPLPQPEPKVSNYIGNEWIYFWLTFWILFLILIGLVIWSCILERRDMDKAAQNV